MSRQAWRTVAMLVAFELAVIVLAVWLAR